MSRNRAAIGIHLLPSPALISSVLISSVLASSVVLAPAALAAGPGITTPTPVTLAAGDPLPAKGLYVGEGATPVPDVLVSAWMVADATTGQVLAARDPRVQLRPASTLKMLTVLAAAPNLDPSAPYIASEADAAENGSRIPLVPGETYTVDNLLSGIFLRSGNDAAHALATANGGVEKTMADMRAEAARIGAVDTTVENVTGLEEATPQYSTAQDLVLIAREGLKLPVFAKYAGTREAMMPGYFDEKKRRYIAEPYPIYTDNRLLNHDYPGALGVKDGFTRAAGRTFVGAAERDGHTLIVSMLNIIGVPYGSTKALLDWGFANVGKSAPIATLPEPSRPAAWQAPGVGTVDGAAGSTVEVAAAQTASEGAGLPGPLKTALLVLGLLVAAVVGLRARAVMRMRRRAALRAQHSTRHSIQDGVAARTTDATTLAFPQPVHDYAGDLDGLEEISA